MQSQLVMFSECLKDNQILQLREESDKGMLRKCEKTNRIDLMEKLVFFFPTKSRTKRLLKHCH